MKTTSRGSLYSVTVSREEVAAFRSRWPCSTLPDRPITFWFDRITGDLVDAMPFGLDGSDALALSYDAQEAGRRFLDSLTTTHA